MTLVLALTGRDSIWLLADRRLSFGKGRTPKDDACKVCTLHTFDGDAILGYAGLGATALGTQPSDWMSNVLRGTDLTIEGSLAALTDAATRQLPQHLVRVPSNVRSHAIVVPCFVGDEARVYSIEHVIDANSHLWYRYARHVWNKLPSSRHLVPRLFRTGSGAAFLPQDRDWTRDLLRLIKAYERKVLSAEGVAQALAQVNFDVSQRDSFVGRDCIVTWQHRRAGAFNGGGGGHLAFAGVRPLTSPPMLPNISRGGDMRAAVLGLGSFVMDRFKAGFRGTELVGGISELNDVLKSLPDKPDEKLR